MRADARRGESDCDRPAWIDAYASAIDPFTSMRLSGGQSAWTLPGEPQSFIR
jgi:hypothetical protein